MRIILLYPRWTEAYGIFALFAKKASMWPPLNLAYLAAIAEKKGHTVRIIDGELENISIKEMIKQTAAFKPDLIGITATTPFFHIAVELAQGLKMDNGSVPVIIGGAHITMLKEKAFSSSFDYAFIGEAENSWSRFLDCYESGNDISDIKGIIYRNGEEVIFTGMPEPVNDLDSIPFPARHLLNVKKYKRGTLYGTKAFTTLMPTRGCPYKCIFCSSEVFGYRVRKRSVQSVINEMKSVISEFGVKHFYIYDDNITIDRKYILELCSLIRKEKLSVTFEGSTRANLIDDELISVMAKSGLIRMAIGLESVDSEVRRIMKKEVPLECYSVANRINNKYGVETLNSAILGMPGETRKTAEKTINYLANAREIQLVSISIAVPYPGTELYEMAKKGDHGLRLLTEDFSKYRRYGTAVMEVNDLTAQDLIKLQNDSFLKIYSAPWRIIPMLKRNGMLSAVLMLVRLIKKISNDTLSILLASSLYNTRHHKIEQAKQRSILTTSKTKKI